MVFDCGGGTLDVAVISTLGGRLTVVNSEGDNYFGGTDIDKLVFNQIILPALEEKYVVKQLLDNSTTDGRMVMRTLLLKCENCKIELSTAMESKFQLSYDEDDEICDDVDNEIEFEYTIHRSQLEDLIAPTVERSIEIAKRHWKEQKFLLRS